MSDRDPTVGELQRRLDRMEAEEAQRRYISLERYEADQRTNQLLFQQLTTNVTELKDSQRWATRLLLGGFAALLLEGLAIVFVR